MSLGIGYRIGLSVACLGGAAAGPPSNWVNESAVVWTNEFAVAWTTS